MELFFICDEAQIYYHPCPSPRPSVYRHILEHFILFGVSGTAKAPSGFNATAAGGVYKAYLTSYIK